MQSKKDIKKYQKRKCVQILSPENKYQIDESSSSQEQSDQDNKKSQPMQMPMPMPMQMPMMNPNYMMYNPYMMMMMQQPSQPMNGMMPNHQQIMMPMMNQQFLPGTQMGPQFLNLSNSQDNIQPTQKKRQKKSKKKKRNDQDRQELNNWQSFNKYTLPKIQVRKVMKIQALFRGALVRKKRVPQIKKSHQGAKLLVDSLIEEALEIHLIPDIILQVLAKNKVYENFDYYSPDNQMFYRIRQSIISETIRPMILQIIKEYTTRMVTDYLNKRFQDKSIDQQDPLRALTNQIILSVLKQELLMTAKESINQLVNEYIFESQFIILYNRVFLYEAVKQVVQQAVEDFSKIEYVQNLIFSTTASWIPALIQQTISEQQEQKSADQAEQLFKLFLDRLILEESVRYLKKAAEQQQRLRIMQEKKLIQEKLRLQMKK